MTRDNNPCPCGCNRARGTHIRALHLTEAEVDHARRTGQPLPTLCGVYGIPNDRMSMVARLRRRAACGCCLHRAVGALREAGVIGPKAEVGR